MSDLIKIPARKGKVTLLKKGQIIKIINTHGHQVVDTWVFNVSNLNEFSSNEHMRVKLSSIFPKSGEPIYTK